VPPATAVIGGTVVSIAAGGSTAAIRPSKSAAKALGSTEKQALRVYNARTEADEAALPEDSTPVWRVAGVWPIPPVGNRSVSAEAAP